MTTAAAVIRGVTGPVIDGCVRDLEEIDAAGFRVFCRGSAIPGTGKDDRGSVGGPIQIGDVQICAGDLVFADRDGAVIVRANDIKEVAEAAARRVALEQIALSRLRAGVTTVSIFGGQTALTPASCHSVAGTVDDLK